MIDDRYGDRYIVDTPEHIEFGYDIAGIGSRFLAALIDHAVFFVVVYGSLSLLITMMDASEIVQRTLAVATTLLYCGYYIAFERLWNGQTPGKRLMGLRVVQDAGRPIGMSASLVRNFVRIVDFFPLFYGVGIVAMFMDKRTRRLGDLAAATLVVRDRQRVSLDDLLAATTSRRVASALSSNGQTILPNLETLQPNDVSIVQEFLLRRNGLPLDRRQRVAGQLAYALFQRLGYSVPGDPELFLQQVTDQYVSLRGQTLLR
ncbi:MAG TPA: RDD family protein [Herpetosiphonaceae bacterium]